MLLTGGAGETERLAELLAEHHMPFRRAEPTAEISPAWESLAADDLDRPVCWLGRGSIPQGVLIPSSNLLVLGTQDLFDASPVAARPAAARSHISTFLSDFRDLEPGDYVVHVENGIGCYRGLKELTADGLAQEPGVAGRMFRTLSAEGINIDMISAANTAVTCLIDSRFLAAATGALEKEFFGELTPR